MTLDDFTKVGNNTYASNESFTYKDDNIEFKFKYVVYCHEYMEWDYYKYYARYETYIALDKDCVHQIHKDRHDFNYNNNYGLSYLTMFAIIAKSNLRKGELGKFSEKEFNKIVKNLEETNISYQLKKSNRIEKFKGILEGTNFPVIV